MPKVKDTYLSTVKIGDLLLYRYRGLIPEGDFLGALIAWGEGNTGRDGKPGFSKGDYTHVARVFDCPDPEAEVEEVKPGIFRVIDSKMETNLESRPSFWEDEIIQVKRQKSRAGIKFEATWPLCQQWVIDWENPYMEVWRMRDIKLEDLKVIRALDDAAIGKQYDLAEFITFGNLRLPNAAVCSEIAATHPYYASIAVNTLYSLDRAPIILTPDVKEMLDTEITPNDVINSGRVYKIRYQGLL